MNHKTFFVFLLSLLLFNRLNSEAVLIGSLRNHVIALSICSPKKKKKQKKSTKILSFRLKVLFRTLGCWNESINQVPEWKANLFRSARCDHGEVSYNKVSCFHWIKKTDLLLWTAHRSSLGEVPNTDAQSDLNTDGGLGVSPQRTNERRSA